MGTELTPAALTKLGRDATKEHRLCLKLGNQSLEHANLCGAYLQQAKDSLPHGEWGDWLAENFSEASDATARVYMRVSGHWAELSQNESGASVLSIRGALKALAKPRLSPWCSGPGGFFVERRTPWERN